MKDREPDVLWMEVHDVVQEAVIKTIPTKKKCKKAKWLSEEALKIAEKRKEAESQGEKERYTMENNLKIISGLGKSPGEEMAMHSNILAWRSWWREKPGGLQSMGSQRVRHD